MAWFRRTKRQGSEPVPEGDGDQDVPELPGRGPFDSAAAPDRGEAIDLGALRVPATPGMSVRIELDATTKAPLAATVGLGESAMQLQVYAAPKSRGLWDEVRAERAETARAQSGAVTEQHGPFGSELVVKIPVTTPAGSGLRPIRFVGVDGPRWMLQATIYGPAALNATAANPLEEILAGVVVHRGEEPLPPKNVIALTVPGQAAPPEAAPGLAMPGRGPEIQEIR